MKYIISKPIECSDTYLINLACEYGRPCESCSFLNKHDGRCTIKENLIGNIIDFLKELGYDVKIKKEDNE